MAFENGRIWGDGSNSSIGAQLITFFYQKKALIDLVPKRYFGQLADTVAMPKHHGQTIKRYHYIPLLDDRNINDQGIDATGATVTDEVTITITDPAGMSRYAVGNGSSAPTALTAAQAVAVNVFINIGVYDGTSYASTVTLLTAAGWTIVVGPAVNSGGNLYGSSRDVGTIVGRMPVISETGGRVNRVGFTRRTIEGRIHNYGFFDEYTEDSIQFDTDAELMMHISRETLNGANEITEDLIQMDLLEGANVVFYGGDATSMGTITGNAGSVPSVLDLETLTRIETTLNNNRCPRDTTIITGSRMIDTRTIGATRYAYCGPELKLDLLKMTDFFNNAAFIPIQQYGEAGKIAAGEIGSIGNFRFIENAQMMHWSGQGAAVTTNDGYIESNGKYNVYPILIVGSGSFTTIGFQTNASTNSSDPDNNVKFQILHRAPGKDTADRNDPYGKTGFYSIQWWYGSMILRPEWLACIKVAAHR